MVVHRASRMLMGAIDLRSSTTHIFHQLMLSKALIKPEHKGIYSILPIGDYFLSNYHLQNCRYSVRVITKLVNVIEDELNAAGAYKISMPILGGKQDLWEVSGRWSDFEQELFRVTDRAGNILCLQPTHEEMITRIVAAQGVLKHSIFPLMLYQTGSKFRDESSSGHGLLRSREFLMNDLYTFDVDEHNARKTYQLISEVYQHILKTRLGLEFYVVRADSGAIGGNISHEYHLRVQAGEDSISVCEKCNKGISKQLAKRGENPCESCSEKHIAIIKSAEIAHTFLLGDLFTSKFSAKSSSRPLMMNCYGIGIGRLLAAIVEALSPSKKSMRLPHSIVPFKVAIIPSKKAQSNSNRFAEDIICALEQNVQLKDEIFVDDRVDNSIGRRIVTAANLGIPNIIVIGNRTERSMDGKPVVEYYKTTAASEDPVFVDDLVHEELFKIAQNL